MKWRYIIICNHDNNILIISRSQNQYADDIIFRKSNSIITKFTCINVLILSENLMFWMQDMSCIN